MEYKEIKVLQLENMTARVYIPVLTEEERAKRMQAIEKRAAELLRKGN